MDTAAEFWAAVEKGPGCWLWLRARIPTGYGHVRWGGLQRNAARVAWQLTYGPIPDGLRVCHYCDNPPCVKPAHLFLGTREDSARDRARRGRIAAGERHGMARLSFAQVREIRKRYEAGGISQRA